MVAEQRLIDENLTVPSQKEHPGGDKEQKEGRIFSEMPPMLQYRGLDASTPLPEGTLRGVRETKKEIGEGDIPFDEHPAGESLSQAERVQKEVGARWKRDQLIFTFYDPLPQVTREWNAGVPTEIPYEGFGYDLVTWRDFKVVLRDVECLDKIMERFPHTLEKFSARRGMEKTTALDSLALLGTPWGWFVEIPFINMLGTNFWNSWLVNHLEPIWDYSLNANKQIDRSVTGLEEVKEARDFLNKFIEEFFKILGSFSF